MPLLSVFGGGFIRLKYVQTEKTDAKHGKSRELSTEMVMELFLDNPDIKIKKKYVLLDTYAKELGMDMVKIGDETCACACHKSQASPSSTVNSVAAPNRLKKGLSGFQPVSFRPKKKRNTSKSAKKKR